MDCCFKCERGVNEVKLLDAIDGNEIVKICEECAFSESMPIIRMPNTTQLKESEKPYSVYERLRRMSGMPDKENPEVKAVMRKITDANLDYLRQKSKEKEIDEKYNLAKKKNIPLNLVDNFNWHIIMARKKRKLSRKQVAEALGESETAIKMVENKELPDDYLRLINKFEQFFGIVLKKEGENIPASRGISVRERLEKMQKQEKPAVVLNFSRESLNKITIADLKEIRDRKEKIEAGEKEKKIERISKDGADVSELIWQIDKEEKAKERQDWKEDVKETMIGEVEVEE